jgi:eukaryotic-like serine/threonine-protein kinase
MKPQAVVAPWAAGPAPGSSEVLTPELLQVAVRRLKIVAVLNTLIPCLIFLIDLTFHRPMATPASQAIAFAALALASLMGLSLAWLCFRLEPRTLLDIAVVYEIALGFLIAVQSHSAPIEYQQGSRGWPVVAVWMITFAILIPNTRRKTILATLATAAMDPAGLVVHLLAGAPVPSPSGLFLIFFPIFIAAAIAIVLSRILYDLTVAVSRAQELGSYHLVRPLGRGGMGEVWQAEHRMLARPAAIKLIRSDGLGAHAPEVLKRFEREAKATAALRSPHTVAVYDFGLTEDGAFYYVMELLTGLNLDMLVGQHGPVPPERAVYLLLQVCESLEEAHARELVHRDIKPANIFVCRYGLAYDFVKLLDFGLVRSTGFAEDTRLTATGVVAGSPEYMAPEIARSERDFDARVDIYSLGCVAYWLVTGKPVFEGASPVDVLIEHVQASPAPPSQRARQPIPPELEAIILSCLQKDPARRPQSARELAEALQAVPVTPWTPERAAQWWRNVSLASPEDAGARETPALRPSSSRVARAEP